MNGSVRAKFWIGLVAVFYLSPLSVSAGEEKSFTITADSRVIAEGDVNAMAGDIAIAASGFGIEHEYKIGGHCRWDFPLIISIPTSTKISPSTFPRIWKAVPSGSGQNFPCRFARRTPTSWASMCFRHGIRTIGPGRTAPFGCRFASTGFTKKVMPSSSWPACPSASITTNRFFPSWGSSINQTTACHSILPPTTPTSRSNGMSIGRFLGIGFCPR